MAGAVQFTRDDIQQRTKLIRNLTGAQRGLCDSLRSAARHIWHQFKQSEIKRQQ
jgi:hypothetical protein